MGWNGSGGFSRLYSWVADKAAGLNITASRMDADSNDIATNGFGNCLTRDGQGQPTATLPMAGFRHTGVGNGAARTDYAALNQAQDGLINWSVATGTDDYGVILTPALTVLADGQLIYARIPNTQTRTSPSPTLSVNALASHPITKIGGVVLVSGDMQANQECIFRYNLANTRWELLNPAGATVSSPTTGDVKLTIKTTADAGWLLFDDGTFGSATSGSSNSNSAANQALFTLMFNNLSDTAAPLLTSGGAGTTRAGQGTAAAAWAANCRMTLPKTLGRALAVAGAGSGLTSRALGAIVGEESHLLTTGEIPSHTHTNSLTDPGHTHSQTIPAFYNSFAGGGSGAAGAPSGTGTTGSSTTGITINNAAQGGGGTHNNMQPTAFLNAMIKQ